MRVSVARRPALDHVREVDVAPLEPDAREQPVEQLSRLTDERHALLVLVEPGRLADEHQLSVGVARAEDDLRAPGREGAPLTRRRLLGVGPECGCALEIHWHASLRALSDRAPSTGGGDAEPDQGSRSAS